MTADHPRAAEAARLRAARKARVGDYREMARRLRDAAGDRRGELPTLDTIVWYLRKRWENPRFPHGPSERYRLLICRVLGMAEDELFGGGESLHMPEGLSPPPFEDGRDDPTKRRRFILDFLAALGLATQAHALVDRPAASHLGREHVLLLRAALYELERQEAQQGGGRLYRGTAALLETVQAWIHRCSYPADIELEARLLSYMALQARHRGRPREAVQLAQTALRISAGWATPRMGALLHLRAAQSYADIQEHGEFRRHLARAKNLYEAVPHEDDPSFLAALTPDEVVGIEAMSLVSWGRYEKAARLFGQVAHGGPTPYLRNNAYYAVRFAEALFRAGDHSGAFEAAQAAVPLVASVSSARTGSKLTKLRQGAEESTSTTAREFRDGYDEAFGEER